MKKIAIIGAGPAGLVSAKSCREAGLSPVVFEKASDVGGLWSSAAQAQDGVGAWGGMRTNLSRWSCMFSDFPWREGSNDFPRQSDVAQYLSDYARHFNLMPDIHCGVTVTNVRRDGSGYVVETLDSTGKTNNHACDGVIVASGFFSKPYRPFVFGEDQFQGRISHAGQFNPADIDPDSLPVIVGGSFSAYELAAEFAKVCHRPPLHVVRHPSWILSRYIQDASGQDVPSDLLLYSRSKAAATAHLSPLEKTALKLKFFEATFGNPEKSHPLLWVDPNPKFPPYVAISDDYPDLVRTGHIRVAREYVSEFQNSHFLKLSDGARYATDHVVFATGYQARMDFLGKDILQDIAYKPNDQFMPITLMDATWPRTTQGIGFVGMYRGPYFGVMELQARWVAGAFAGQIEPPTPEERTAGVKAAQKLRDIQHRPQFPYGDYVGFADHLARKVGCYPELDKDDPLYALVHDKTFLPCHYRLTGDHANRAVAEDVVKTIPYIKP